VLKVVSIFAEITFSVKDERLIEIIKKLPMKEMLERAFSPFSAIDSENNEVIKLGASIFGNLFGNSE